MDTVEHYPSGEFDLLRHSRTDIRDEAWTRPAQREATVKYFRLLRAREEIVRVNVELRRLHTFIHDEELQMREAIQGLSSETSILMSHLVLELQRCWKSRSAINALHKLRIHQIIAMPGFSGVRDIGVHASCARDARDEAQPNYVDACSNIDDQEYADPDIIQQDEHNMELEDLAGYLDSIVD